jgi:hypothetical protein
LTSVRTRLAAMPESPSAASEAELAVVLEFAGLSVSPDRLAVHHDAYTSTLALIRLASVAGLGETVPATAFKAHWD